MSAAQKAKVRQVLRDPETLDFLSAKLDVLVEYMKTEARENGTEVQARAEIKRVRLVQKNIQHNASQARARAGEEFPDEI